MLTFALLDFVANFIISISGVTITVLPDNVVKNELSRLIAHNSLILSKEKYCVK